MNATNDKKSVQSKPAGRKRSCLGCLGRGATGLGIFLVIALVAGLIYQASASASDLKKYPPPGELYDLGAYRLHLYCTGAASATGATGEGSPTVILEAVSGLPALTWYLVQTDVTSFARVCSYDRAGFGWSDPASGPLSPNQVAADLHKLLETAHVPGPYILVGHSAGGLYVRAYASQYPSEVVGMVLVDAVREQQNMRYPPEYVKLMSNSNAIMPVCQIMSPFGWVRALKILNSLIGENIPADIG